MSFRITDEDGKTYRLEGDVRLVPVVEDIEEDPDTTDPAPDPEPAPEPAPEPKPDAEPVPDAPMPTNAAWKWTGQSLDGIILQRKLPDAITVQDGVTRIIARSPEDDGAFGSYPWGFRAEARMPSMAVDGVAGKTWQYGVRLKVDPSTPWPNAWMSIFQFHGGGSGVQPVLALELTPDRQLLMVRRGGSTTNKALWSRHVIVPKFEKGKWYDLRWTTKWSEGSDGFVRMQVNGGAAVESRGPTKYPARSPYAKTGWYGPKQPGTKWTLFVNHFYRASAGAAPPQPEPEQPQPDPVPGPDPDPKDFRVAFEHPFSSDSPWNVKADGCQFASVTDIRTQHIRHGAAGLNAGGWSHPIFQARESDPVRTIRNRDKGGSWQFKVPDSAKPAAAPGNPYSGPGDAHLYIVEPNGRWMHEMWSVIREPNGNLSCRHYVKVDLLSSGVGADGVRAYGGSGIAGLIRRKEILAGHIDHVLAVAMNHKQMKVGPVWPATRQDGNSSRYAGSVPMGQLMVIPPNVNLKSAGLSAGGLILATAAQEYGCMLVDGAARFVFYAEPSAEGLDLLKQMRADASKVQDMLVAVTNNTKERVQNATKNPLPVRAAA